MKWAYYNEFDPHKAEWLRELIKRGVITDGEVDERSIIDVHPDDLKGFRRVHTFAGIGIWDYALNLAGWGDGEVWTGSAPCQPFSAAGKRKGKEDERHLFPAWFRLIEARRPLVVFGEQVSSTDGLSWFNDVLDCLDAAGYTVGALDTCAAGVGAPHLRQRLYFVANAETPIGRGAGIPANGRRGTAQAGGSGTAGVMADAEHFGIRSVPAGGRDIRSQGQSTGDIRRAGPVNGFWRDASWVLTRPERVGDAPGLRPVESGTFPLAARSPARVLRLRGYGDGINTGAASAFIKAAMECIYD